MTTNSPQARLSKGRPTTGAISWRATPATSSNRWSALGTNTRPADLPAIQWLSSTWKRPTARRPSCCAAAAAPVQPHTPCHPPLWLPPTGGSCARGGRCACWQRWRWSRRPTIRRNCLRSSAIWRMYPRTSWTVLDGSGGARWIFGVQPMARLRSFRIEPPGPIARRPRPMGSARAKWSSPSTADRAASAS